MLNTNRQAGNRTEPILTSISFSVDNHHTPSPPSYDYVIKHPNLNQNNELQPPSYESIYERVRNAHRTIRQTIRNNGTNNPSSSKLANVLGCFVFFIFFIIAPIVKIIVGINYRDECPINLSIPLWLIIDGIFFLLLVISIAFFKYLDCSLMTSVLGVFLVSWLVRGSVWVYSVRQSVSFNPLVTSFYCSSLCYQLAFWNITITWGLIASIILTLIFAVVCSKNQTAAQDV